MTEQQIEAPRRRIQDWILTSSTRDPRDQNAPFHDELKGLTPAEYAEVLSCVRRTKPRYW